MGNNIGKRIKLYRETKNMSQQELSSEAGVSLGLIQQIEQERHDNPSINVLNKISDVLDVDIINILREAVSTKNGDATIEALKKKVHVFYIPVFDHLPTDAEINLKDLSKVLALVPGVNNRAEYALKLTKECGSADPFKENDAIGIRRVKHIKSNCIYLIKTKDNNCHVIRSKIYKSKKLFFYSNDPDNEPIEFNSNVKVIGEVVRWYKNPLNDALPGPKIKI